MGAGSGQKISTAKLPVLSKTLKKSKVTMGLALVRSHNIKQFTNLRISLRMCEIGRPEVF